MEDISRRLKRLETARAQKKQFHSKQQNDHRASRTTSKQTVLPNENAKPFIPRIAKNNNNGQNVLPTNQPVPRPTAPPPNLQQN